MVQLLNIQEMSKYRRKLMRKSLSIVLALSFIGIAADVGLIEIGDNQAWAVVGRPLTPMSYAGVARRTSRRTARRTTARVSGAYGYGTIAALPAGCMSMTIAAVGYYRCGSIYYQPNYQGTNVVYVQVEPPPQG
jgi:hypothetical protein